jgi:MFS transporter, NRE family, putaive nickel resistance protein
MKSWFQGFEILKNPVFTKLYAAQTINLVGDSLTWVGLALLAFDLAGESSGTVLAGALTLRVTAFVLLAPLAGAIADQVDRKKLMITTHLARMGIVCLLPFVTQVWQIYAIVLCLNIFAAFFTPTYTATIPLVTTKETHSKAIALSSATYQLLGVLGPGLAGGVAAFMGTRSVFFLDGITFLAAAILILTLPGQLMVNQNQQPRTIRRTLNDIRIGTVCLWADVPIRYALIMQLIAAIAGAEILVNTVSHIQATLNLNKLEYGWAMAAFGIGATLASVGLGRGKQKFNRTVYIGIGAVLITLALLPANWITLGGLLLLWSIAGIGQTLVNVPTQTLIADRVAVEIQGRVYGAHFAWSHFWWAFAYPLAGWMGSHFPARHFFYSGLIGLMLLVVAHLVYAPRSHALKNGLWHDHDHSHDDQHQHHTALKLPASGHHHHLHFHDSR